MTREQKQTIRDALSTTNPFMLRGETGRIILYENAKECYQSVLTGLFAECPAGFVDVAYYMMKYQRLTPAEVWNILRQKEYAYIPWWEKSPERNERLKAVLRLLLKPSGCSLDEDLFRQSLDNLDALLDKQGVRENLRKLNVIIFIN